MGFRHQHDHGRLEIHSTRSRFVAAAGLLAVLAAGCQPSSEELIAEHSAAVDRYCVDCHNDAERTGDLSLERLDLANVADHAETLEAAVRKLRGRLMPPPGEPQPSGEELWRFVGWLEENLDAAATEPRPGRVPLQRLNRREYANAVSELLGVTVDPEQLLPQDDTRGGFDNIADALQVSPSFLEQYVGAARSVAVRAVGQPHPRPGSTTYNVSAGNQQFHVQGLPLGTRGGALVEHQFPADGEYEINIADVSNGLWANNMPFENTLIVTLDGKRIYQTVLGGEEDMKAFDQRQDPALDAINARLKNIRFEATAGPHEVGVTFLRRTLAESDDRLQSFTPGGGQDRVFRVSSFQISGPFDPTGLSPTPSRERIFSCYPTREDEQRACAEEIVSSIGTRAFRRPLTETDVQELMQYYLDGVELGGFEEGIRSAITGILASPYFLYRAERVPEDTLQAGEVYEITDLEIASRLSFFLWSSVPDEELLDLALQGRLRDPAVREQQVRRMLADPRAQTLSSSFAYQWLHLDKLSEVNPDGAIFPYASGAADPRRHFLREITLFVDDVFREDRSVIDLLDADYTYLNEPLALLYGVRDVKGDHFRRVQLEDSRRWGLLGKGAVLMASSYPNRTAPVLRGAYVLEHILGTPPAPPLPDVEALQENEVGSQDVLTVREMMSRHSQDPTCYACHAIMDPLGFALENFNAVGVWRDRDRFAGVEVDASGELPDGTRVEGPDDLREALLRRPEQFVQTLTERLLTYALGRELDYRDMPVVRGIVRDIEPDDYRFSSLVVAIVNSPPFTMRQVPEREGGAELTASSQNLHFSE